MGKGYSAEEFNKFLNRKLDEDKIELFYRANAINPLRVELFRDFTISLIDTVHNTYPGDDVYKDDYYLKHFNYCFNRVINNFKQENIMFPGDSKDLHDYFFITLEDSYYRDSEKERTSNVLKNLYDRLFDMENVDKTLSDMEIFVDIYKSYLKLFIKK